MKSEKSDAARAFEELFEAYDAALASMRDRDGRPIQATELEKIALLNRLRKRLAINAKMPPGYNGALTVEETAHRLGVCKDQVYRLCREGRLNPVKVDGRLYIPPEEVRAYRRQQQIWAAQGGRWTPYGREEKKDPESSYKPVGQPGSRGPEERGESPDHPLTQSPNPPTTQQPDDPTTQEWLTMKEAAAILGIGISYIHALGCRGTLLMRREPRGKQGAAVRLRLDSVLALAGERESEAWKRGISPKRWRDDLLHPTIRTDIEAPPGDRLITRAEAAEILGVVPERVGELVRDGRLFGWQKKPGRQGCRLLLSERQVLRYAEDPMRMKRRLAAVEGSAPSELKVGNNWTEWREWHHLVRYTSAHSDRDRGEFLTAAQAALLLGITIRSVQRLRQKGRVQGYRRTNARQSWWFFRREEIENLLADCGYAQGRRTAHKALQTIRARKAEKPAITYSRYRDEDDRR